MKVDLYPNEYIHRNNNICSLVWVTIAGILIGIWIYCTLTTNNYRAIANSYTLQFSTSRLLSLLCLHQSLPGYGSQQCPRVPSSRSYRLATAPQLSTLSSLQLNSADSNCPLITLRHGPHSKRHFSAVCGHCLATVAVQSHISRSPPSNWSTCHSMQICNENDSGIYVGYAKPLYMNIVIWSIACIRRSFLQ
jgi:hypothetical protein